MAKRKTRKLLPFGEYVFFSLVLEQLSAKLLKQFLSKSGSRNIKHVILCNFLARSIVSIRGIIQLWEINDFHDCWILLRCMLDRLFHLKFLKREDSYKLFEKWSFKKKYEYMLLLKQQENDPTILSSDFFNVIEEEKERYRDVVKENPKWKRPNIKDFTKEIGLNLLYHQGYDYASGMVHPLATDGQEDLLYLLKMHRAVRSADNRIVLHNALLTELLLFQQVLDDSDFNWNKRVYSLLSKLLDFVGTGDYGQKQEITNNLNELDNVVLCKKID